MSDSSSFLQVWYSAMIVGGIIAFSVGVLLLLIHNLRVTLIKDFKQKYDYININEIKWYKRAFLSFGVGVGLFINLYGSDSSTGLTTIGVWFFVRLFFGIAGATLVAYVSDLILEYYYPTKLDAKLKKWRYMPRINPKTGNKMRLLSEEEEDVHLDPGRQAEENIFSIDYDVWVDEKTKDVQIEKYDGHLTALRCNNCGFYTMKVVKEEIAEVNEDGSPKELLKHYRCSYCKNVRATAFVVSKKESEDYKELKEISTQRNTKNVELVKIEIHSVLSGKKFFEFQSIEQAQKFLAEFDPDKSA
jgi:hypothetical protein